MKKGFTLAEVLITMAIIGVIAAVTLPALNVNVTERSAITRYQKALSTLNNIGAMVTSNDGFNYSDIAGDAVSDATRGNNENGNLRRQVWAVFDKYGKIDRRLTNSGQIPAGGDCSDPSREGGTIFFKDGSALCYYGTDGNEGRVLAIIDINGLQGPNEMFSCDDANCTNRVIGDQFEVTLIGDEAYPGTVEANNVEAFAQNGFGWAAVWASQQ